MNYLSALAIVLGIASGVISLYEFLKKGSWRPGVAYSIAAAILLVAAVIVANLPSPSGTGFQASGVSTVQNSSTASSGIGATPAQATPIPTPSPTPIPEPKNYKADWSTGMDGWMTSDNDWHTVNGLLVNDGMQHSTIIAPYPPNDIADYSVQTDIRLDQYSQNEGEVSFGIIVRSPDGSGGYQLSVCASALTLADCGGSSDPDYELILSDGGSSTIAQTPFKPHYTFWHTYRIDVQGNRITVWLDGRMVFQVTNDTYLSAGRVGLWSDGCQISVRSFTITAL